MRNIPCFISNTCVETFHVSDEIFENQDASFSQPGHLLQGEGETLYPSEQPCLVSGIKKFDADTFLSVLSLWQAGFIVAT